jgi:nitrate/nitrite-specific signal transduction histidine kinase
MLGRKSIHAVAAVLVAALTTGVPIAARAATEKEFAAAINLAGRQRMLTQKMSKEFLLVALQVDPAGNRTALKQTIELFESSLSRLQKGDADLFIPAPPSPEITAQLETVRASWGTLKPALEKGTGGGAIAPEDVAAVASLNLPVLTEMHKAVEMYDQAAKAAGVQTAGTVVNVAGRQRMLSQKMAKEILLIALKQSADENRTQLKADAELFSKVQAGLVNGDPQLGLPATSNKTILAQMSKVDSLWKEFQPLATEAETSPEVPAPVVAKVADLSPKLLNEMNRAVSMYESESK